MKKLNCPLVTVDIVIRHLPTGHFILIERKNEPHGWALPGGFVDLGETTMTAAVREAGEEVQVQIANVQQFHTYSDPSRDPRGHNVTVVYTAETLQMPEADDDAQNIGWFNPATFETFYVDEDQTKTPIELNDLCFDHSQIIMDVIRFEETGEWPTRE